MASMRFLHASSAFARAPAISRHRFSATCSGPVVGELLTCHAAVARLFCEGGIFTHGAEIKRVFVQKPVFFGRFCLFLRCITEEAR
jgi:hypothetical protein